MDTPPPPRRSSAGFWIAIVLLVLALGTSLFLNLGMGVALLALTPTLHQSGDTPVDEEPAFEEEWSFGSGTTKVVRLQLSGIITRETEAGLFQVPLDPIEELLRAIRAADRDEEVRAILLEVDSPGGGITPSDEVYTALMRFKAGGEDRKIIVLMRDLAASGGYYVAMAGDWLIAQPTTVIGSIGVIMQSLNWKVLSDKIGVTDTTIKSGDNKDMLNPFRETDPEEVALLQDMIDRMHTRFRGIVAQSRGIEPTALAEIADGRIFTADQAMELRLIDQVGYWDDAVAKTAELLGEESVRIVRYYTTTSFWDILAGIQQPFPAPFARLNEAPRFQYLWKP